MARVLSHPYVTVRGSVGGTTYLCNQYHQIVARQRTAPVQPQTPDQQLVRGYLSAASAKWSALTEVQRDGWNDYASTCQWSGPLGTYTIPGRLMFLAALSRARNAGRCSPAPAYVELVTPPIIPGFAELLNDPPAAPAGPAATGYKIKVYNLNTDDLMVFCWRSIAWPLTRYRFKGPFVAPSIKGQIIAPAGNYEFVFTGLVKDMHYFNFISAVTAKLTPGVPHRITMPRIVRAKAVEVV